jgi:hypothetical protein
MTRFAPMLVAALALAACGTTNTEPTVKTVEFDKPVPVVCVPADVPASMVPSLTPAQLLSLNDAAARYQALAAYYLVAAPRLALLEGLISACRSAGTFPPKP